jgi:putative SOS response-associated peptidase YedK
MCGRYVLKTSAMGLQREFGLSHVPLISPRYNIAPTQDAPIILSNNRSALIFAQWGLRPSWVTADDRRPPLINVRTDTLSRHAGFKQLLDGQRCIVPCDGFYEWKRDNRQRLPQYIHPESGGLWAMAGLWNRWRAPAGQAIDTFSLITTASTGALATFHHRMPVLLN